MNSTDLQPTLSALVKDGVFGDFKFVDLQPDETEKGAQFASSLSFMNMTVEGPLKKELIRLVVKRPFSEPAMRQARNSDAMFHNEVTMFKEILPGLGVDKCMYPKMFYGSATQGVEPDNDLIVLENVKYRHFLLSKTKPFLDFDHISLVMRKIAEFHGLSFRLKHENIDKFSEMTKKLMDVVLPECYEQEFEALNLASMERGLKPLLERNIKVDVLKNFLNFMKDPNKIRRIISSPEEPFGVICHGDFCNNNILYKFNELDKPSDLVFFDFQLSQYASPAIDIFFFLYMHTTSDFREKYWDELLKLYWDTLRKSVPNHINIPCFNDFLNHFAKRGVYGYLICSFFLPAMMLKSPVEWSEVFILPPEEKIAVLSTLGGDEGERAISEIVLHLLNKGYIDSFLEFCKEKKI